MKASRIWRHAAACFRDKQIVVIAVLAGLISVSVTLANGTSIGHVLFGYLIAQEATPPPSGTYTPPPSDSTYTPPPSGTYTPPPSGTYTPPPSGSTYVPPYSTGGSYPAGSYPTGGYYPPTGGSYSSGGSYPTGGYYPPTGGSYSSGGSYPAGGYYPAGGMNPADSCKTGCTIGNMPGATPEQLASCMARCDSGPSGPYPPYPGGGGYQDPREQWIMSCMSSNGLSRPQCEAKCSTQGSGCPAAGGAGTGGGGGGGSSMQRCFYPNATINGAKAGFTVWCAADYQDCRQGSPSGQSIPNAGLQLGAPSSCEGGSGYGGGGYQDPREQWMMSCMSSNGLSRPQCEAKCSTQGSGCPQTGGGSSDSCKSNCTIGNMPGATPEQLASCMARCDSGPSGPYPPYSGGNCGPDSPFGRATQGIPGGDPRYKDAERQYGCGSYGGCANSPGGCGGGYQDPREQWIMSCMSSNSLSRPQCEAKCSTQGSGCPAAGGGGSGGGGQWNDMDRQLGEITQRMQNMQDMIAQIASQQRDTSQLKGILQTLTSAIADAKKVMQNSSATPDQTRMAMQNIYEIESKFWRTAESFRGGGQDGRIYGDAGDYGGYASQCDMIRRKMQYVGGNNAAASQLKAMYDTCLEQMQQAATGQGFDEEQFTDIQGQFDAYGEQAYAERACAMVDRVMNEASNAINNEAPMMLKQLGKKNAGVTAQFTGLLARAKELLSRAQGYRQNNNCDKALMVMQDMEKIGQEADRIMSRAQMSFGDQDIQFVDYSEERDNISQRIAKESGVNVKQLKQKLEAEGFNGAELAILDAMDPRLAARLFGTEDSGQGADRVKAAVNANISTTKLEAIIAENARLLETIADLKLQMQNLKAGVKTIVENIKNETFNPRIAPKMAALLEVASTLPEKEFQAKYEQYVQESNDENYKTGIDSFRDVHTFEKDHAWFVAPVKDGVESGLFKGRPDGTFDPNGPVILADMSLVVAREQDVDDSGSSPESVFGKDAPVYAKEAMAGLEELGVDFSEIFMDHAPSDTATRIEVARLVAAVYSDSLSESDASVLEKYTDIDGLSDEDREAVSLVVENGIMTGTNDEFDPNGTFNRAQFATVMQRLSSYTEADADSDIVPADKAAATQTTNVSQDEKATANTAAEAASVEPMFHADAIAESDLQQIRAIVSQAQRQDYSTLGVDREVGKQVSLVNDLVKSLNSIQKNTFDELRDNNYPEEYIVKVKVDLRIEINAAEFGKLSEILKKAGQPIQ